MFPLFAGWTLPPEWPVWLKIVSICAALYLVSYMAHQATPRDDEPTG